MGQFAQEQDVHRHTTKSKATVANEQFDSAFKNYSNLFSVSSTKVQGIKALEYDIGYLKLLNVETSNLKIISYYFNKCKGLQVNSIFEHLKEQEGQWRC